MLYIWKFGRSLVRPGIYVSPVKAGLRFLSGYIPQPVGRPLSDLNDHLLRDIGMLEFQDRYKASVASIPDRRPPKNDAWCL